MESLEGGIYLLARQVSGGRGRDVGIGSARGLGSWSGQDGRAKSQLDNSGECELGRLLPEEHDHQRDSEHEKDTRRGNDVRKRRGEDDPLSGDPCRNAGGTELSGQPGLRGRVEEVSVSVSDVRDGSRRPDRPLGLVGRGRIRGALLQNVLRKLWSEKHVYLSLRS